MNRLVFFGGVEYNLSDKIDEVFDALHAEVDLIRSKYKNVIAGIVLDHKSLEHVTNAVARIFGVADFESLTILLNKLNNSKAPCTHLKFFFDKFKLDHHLMKAVDDYSKRNGLAKLDSTYDALWAIAGHNPELKEDIEEFVKSIHLSRFEPPSARFANLPEFKKITTQASLGEVMLSLRRLQLLHEGLLPEIKKNFNQMSKLAEKLIR